jgi:hypothetical protein
MGLRSIVAGVVLGICIAANAAWAQTADDVVERSLKALGGRPALAALKSRSTVGAIALSSPAGDITGTIEVLNAAPNKTRTVIKADLSALGMGQLTIDQRFDGSAGYVLDSLQGNREPTANELDRMRNAASFPHPFMNYKDLGTSAQLKGKEKVGDREAYVIVFDPASGPTVTQYIDAETYLPVKSTMLVDVPQLGQEVEQTTEYLDYRDVDGVKVPFRLRSSSTVQSFSVTIEKVEHNGTVDEAVFKKPIG